MKNNTLTFYLQRYFVLILFIGFGFSKLYSQDNSCIILEDCPSDVTFCANTYMKPGDTSSPYGAIVNWNTPNFSQTCSGGTGNGNFNMLFELNEQLLSEGCWDFNYISRVGTDGGYVKLFSGNDVDGDKKSKIQTPYLIIEDDTNVSIDLTYSNGNYNVQLFLIGGLDNVGNPYPDITLAAKQVSGTQTTYSWGADFDPGVGSVTGVTGVYRLLFVFTYTGSKPNNANSGDTVIAVKGFLKDSSDCNAGVDFAVTGPNQGFYAVGTYPLEYVATYTSPRGPVITKSCSFTVTVVDVSLTTNVVQPNCSTLGSITATAGVSGSPQFGKAPYTYSLNGGIPQSSGQFNNLSSGNYIITVVDANGCSNSSNTIELIDGDITAPVITGSISNTNLIGCLATDLPVAQTTVSGIEALTGDLTITDNVSSDANIMVSSSDSPSGDCPITVIRTYTVKDECLNESVQFTHTFIINISPLAAIAPTTQTVECENNIVVVTPPTINDACGNTINPNGPVISASPGCEGDLTYTWTYTDCEGNSEDYVHTVTIEREPFAAIAPTTDVVACYADILLPAPPAVTDNCNNPLTPSAPVEGSVPSCEGDLTYTWTYTDCEGNSQDYVHTVTIEDTIKPTFTAPVSVEIFTDADCAYDVTVANTGDVTDEADNCSTGIQATFVDSDPVAGDCQGSFVITRTWSLVDSCGNAADDQTQTITISDNIKPTFTAPVSLTINCEQDANDLAITGDVTDENDNCSIGLEATFVDSVENGECANERIITRTWSLVDKCGNVSENQVQTIIIIDNKSPELVTEFQSELSVNCLDIPNVPILEFFDNCSTDLTVAFEESNSFDENTPTNYDIVRTWTVIDACDNEAVFTQKISVTINETVIQVSDRACLDDGTINLDEYLTNNPVNGTWIITEGTANLNDNIFDPENVALGNYKFSHTSTVDGCLSTTELIIEIHDECVVFPCGREDAVISKVITPNGDSHNEFFTITGIEPCDFIVELQIFNRWGAKIYENFNYKNDWNGFAHSSSVGKADKVPNGTYYYIINFKDSGLKPFAKAFYVGTK